MDLHKYTGIRSVKGECGAGSCPFKVTRWLDAQNPWLFKTILVLAAPTYLVSGQEKPLAFAALAAKVGLNTVPAALLGKAVPVPPAAIPGCPRGEGTSRTFTHQRSPP